MWECCAHFIPSYLAILELCIFPQTLYATIIPSQLSNNSFGKGDYLNNCKNVLLSPGIYDKKPAGCYIMNLPSHHTDYTQLNNSVHTIFGVNLRKVYEDTVTTLF